MRGWPFNTGQGATNKSYVFGVRNVPRGYETGPADVVSDLQTSIPLLIARFLKQSKPSGDP